MDNFITLAEIDQVRGVLEAAVEFEQDTVLFYEMLGSFVEGKENLALLDTIIEEENGHIKVLRDFLESGHNAVENKKMNSE